MKKLISVLLLVQTCTTALATPQSTSVDTVRWDEFSTHRKHVMRLIRDTAKQISKEAKVDRIAILGAGNMNDLDLQRLQKQFAHIDLIDIDEKSMKTGLEFHKTMGNLNENSFQIHTVDVSGVHDCIEKRNEDCLDAAPQFSLLQTNNNLKPADLVVSSCILSQILFHATEHSSEQQIAGELLFTLRNSHINNMIQLTKPGGHGLLITDIVQLNSLEPQKREELLSYNLETLTNEQTESLMKKMAKEGTFFTGMEPSGMMKQFKQHPLVLSATIFPKLWLWEFSQKRYIVMTIQYQRKSAAPTKPRSKLLDSALKLSIEDILGAT